MNFTLDELINAIKYHGHQYDLTTLEILEGIARENEDNIINQANKINELNGDIEVLRERIVDLSNEIDNLKEENKQLTKEIEWNKPL